jgi:C4-dicarboxylate-specific signal transduction histidine kinase
MAEAEPTPWELKRTLDDLRSAVRDGFAAWNVRADRYVAMDLFQAHTQSAQQQTSRLEAAVATEEAERRAEVKALKDEIAAMAKDREMFRRQMILVVAAAALSFLGSLAVAVAGKL